MRTYRQVTAFDPKVAAYLARHRERLIAPTPPRGIWVCEEDGDIVIALTVYTEPHLRISAIIDKPETKPFQSLARLASEFEATAKESGVGRYCVVIHKSDDHYCKIIERRGGVILSEDGQWTEYLHEIDQTPDTRDGIRGWRPSDWKALRPLMMAFLREQYAAGGDIRPTRRNVEAFIRQGVRAAAQHDPTLLVYDEGRIVGFCLWVGMPDGGLDRRGRTCLSIGSFVVPERRRQGWSKQLHAVAVEAASRAGYSTLEGTVLERRGLKVGESLGGSVIGVQVRMSLNVEERKVA
jgi:GNAT superfamily N-acetyltransferase